MTAVSTTRTAALPEGVHRFRIVDFEERKGANAPYWNFTCQVEEDSPYDEVTVFMMISLGASSRWKMEDFLDAMQVEEDSEVEGEDFIGQTFRGNVVHEEYEGKRRPKIANCLPDSGSAGKKKAAVRSGSPKTGAIKPGTKPGQMKNPNLKAAAVDEDEDADEDEDEDLEDEVDDADEEEEEQPVKKAPAKKTSAPAPSKGKLPKDVSTGKKPFKRPF